jgi:hypothetical protein
MDGLDGARLARCQKPGRGNGLKEGASEEELEVDG